jgi:hypothetical protein
MLLCEHIIRMESVNYNQRKKSFLEFYCVECGALFYEYPLTKEEFKFVD